MAPSHPDFAGAIAQALARLQAELSSDLAYHNFWHTQSDVMPAALRLAQLQDSLEEEDIRLLEVATAYHDLGFVEQAENHELIGVRIVAQTLPDFGFGSRQIERIMGMIIATRLPQSPRNLLEQIVADADLDVLGREDFFVRNEALRQESARLGRPFSQREWHQLQFNFLQQHSYFTPAAHTLRDAGKQAHLAELAALIRE